MTVKGNVLSKEELLQIFGTRVSLNPIDPKRIFGKTINETISLKTRIGGRGDFHIAELIFVKCTFNEDIDIGDYINAGKVSFIECIFNKNLRIYSSDVALDENCIFNSSLYIISNENELAVSGYNVTKNLEILGTAAKLKVKNINKNEEILDQKVIVYIGSRDLSLENIKAKTLKIVDDIKFDGTIQIRNLDLV